MVKRSIILLFSIILLNNIALATGDPEHGKELSLTCAACHGADGNSTTALWPNIAGQNEKYIYQQLQAFKKGLQGGRSDPSMTPLMQNLSVKDMEDIAAYFSTQTVKLAVVDPKAVVEGQQIYRGGNLDKKITACGACHGPRGLGNADAAFPALSGQHPQYIVKQLQAYKSGERKSDLAYVMASIAKRMSDKDMQQVAEYVSALH